MKAKSLVERGQALILMALAGIGLFAVVGLAVDGSAKFSDRRHAQNAADAAALAGALTKATSHRSGDDAATTWAKIVNAAEDRAEENGYDTLEVNVYNPPNSGIYADCADVHFDCHDYVQVIIDSTLNTWFARVIGITQLHNHVEAVASTITDEEDFSFGGNAVVALAPSGCNALVAQGGSNVTIYGGGIYSNSDDSTCAFFRQSCPSGTLDIYTDSTETTEGSITMVGSTTSGCISTHADFASNAKQIAFPPPYHEIAEPSQCSETVDLGSNYTVTGTGSNKTAELNPGHYSSIPLSGQWKNVILNPGVYCINSSFSSPTSITVSGTPGTSAGVLLYIRSGGTFTLNGNSSISLWGINGANDSSLEDYNGFLMYVAPNYSLGTPPNCKINGTSDYYLKGTIYAPYCALTIDGTSNTGSFQSQVIGYTVKFAGTADVVLTYQDGDNHLWDIPLQVGLSK